MFTILVSIDLAEFHIFNSIVTEVMLYTLANNATSSMLYKPCRCAVQWITHTNKLTLTIIELEIWNYGSFDGKKGAGHNGLAWMETSSILWRHKYFSLVRYHLPELKPWCTRTMMNGTKWYSHAQLSLHPFFQMWSSHASLVRRLVPIVVSWESQTLMSVMFNSYTVDCMTAGGHRKVIVHVPCTLCTC